MVNLSGAYMCKTHHHNVRVWAKVIACQTQITVIVLVHERACSGNIHE